MAPLHTTSDSTPTPSRRGHRLFLVALVCSALTVVVAAVFFVIGLADGSVSSFNIGLWLGLLSVMFLSLWAGHLLYARSKVALAIAALAVTAVPGVLAALSVLLILVLQPRWN